MKIIKMRYSIEPRHIYVKRYGFLSFAKSLGKNLSNKYGQKPLDSAKKSTTDAIKTASKRAIQKAAEATGNLIGNKIADKIASVSTRKAAKYDNANNEIKVGKTSPKNVSIASPKDVPKKDTCLQKKDNKLLMS